MDNFKLHDVLNKILTLSFEERNVMYFKLKSTIDDMSSDEAARSILSKIIDILAESKLKIENELLTEVSIEASEGKEFKGIFRRVPS